MLASLFVLGAAFTAQNQQFPKPNVDTPTVLTDKAVFRYLGDGDQQLQWKPLEVGRDWSGLAIPAIKPDALRLKVLLTVAERDFSDPLYSNILEMRDKTRLLEASARLKSLVAVTSNGTINLDIIPRFYPEPIYDLNDFRELVDTEYNKSKFEADDSIERGPFAAVIAISSSHVKTPRSADQSYPVMGFADLGGSSQDMWLEESLYYVLQGGIQRRLASHFAPFGNLPRSVDATTSLADQLSAVRGDYTKLYDPTFRQDGDLITKWANEPSPQNKLPFPDYGKTVVQSPGSVEAKDGALVYSELSLMRAGAFALPASSKWASTKSVRFDVKTTSRNPMAMKFYYKNSDANGRAIQKEVVFGSDPGMIQVPADGNWHAISIRVPDGSDLQGATIGVPASKFGTTRVKAELLQYSFRNFDLSGEQGEANPASVDLTASPSSEEEFRNVLTNGSKIAKRVALRDIEKIKAFKSLTPVVQTLTSDFDSAIAYDATKAYFELLLTGTPTAEELVAMGKYLSAPPNEASRLVALMFIPRHPAFAAFPSVAACSVRESWQIRRRAFEGLKALYNAGVREKEACRQLLLISTAQEMGIMRKTAITNLDPSLDKEIERIEYTMVNDPCEAVRLACLKILSTNKAIAKEKILGTVADDSPTLREQIPATLGPSHPLYREALQKLVVDQDPYVRVSALKGFVALGSVQDGEIQNVFTDKHPAVQLAVIEGAKKGAWKIPAEALERFKTSNVKAVAESAAEIK